MGESDPRRSSRARTAQSQPQVPSSSSSTSGRAERSSRSSTNKTSSPQLTTPAASTTASEPPDDASATGADSVVRTLRSRARDSNNSDRHRDRTSAANGDRADMASSENEIQDDDESVRCICGLDDYPGPPVIKEDQKHGSKDAVDVDPFLAADVPDEIAGFFLQCDVCKVWQHGGCVGILNAASSPDEYFCEQCRKDLHKISVASNGQRYSHYLPVNRQSRSASRQMASKEKETPKSPKGREARNNKSAPSLASKRRSTLNSRGVYDEEEELRRAIEASKEDAPPDEQESGVRRTKRGRSDSEEKPDSTKRQRTGSRSPSPPDETAIQDDSDDAPVKNGSIKNKSRSAAARNQREKTEKEEREKLKAEAANKRKSRAERRRAEDSDPSEEVPLATRAAQRAEIQPPPPPRNASPPQPTPDKPEKTSSKSKKSGSRKKGRNQYTKDRDRSPGRSQSRDVPDSGGGSGNSRPRNARSHAKQEKDKDMSWIDMERRIAYWTDFTQRVEQDLNLDCESSGQDKDKGKGAEKEKAKEKDTNTAASTANGASTALSVLLAPPSGAPLNGGSPLKNVVQGPCAGDAPTIAVTNGENPHKTEMNIQERLDFIKGKIKSWHSNYGVETRT